MALSKKYQYLILCEDKQTQCFARKFLEYEGIPRRKIHSLALPIKGCGEQYVRRNYPDELQKIRAKNYNRKVLVVCIDADNRSVDKTVQLLKNACVKENIKTRGESECVCFMIPKRNIETWIKAAEEGIEKVSEAEDYGHYSGEESSRGKRAKEILDMIHNDSITNSGNTSLLFFREEYFRLEKCQKSI